MKKINFYKYLINLSLPVAFIAFLFFMIGIIKMVPKEPIKLEGHWHLKKMEHGVESSENRFYTIDFMDDNIVVLDKGYGGISGSHDSKSQSIHFGGECFMLNFFYSIEKDELKLFRWGSETDDDYLLAVKCEQNCCDKQKDYFSYQDIGIDLPISKKEICFQQTEKSLENRMYFGLPKEANHSSTYPSYQLVLGERFSKVEDIDLYIEKHKIKVAENKRNRIYRVIYADKNTPMETIIPVLERLKEIGEERVFFATRRKDMSKGLIICLTRIDLENHHGKEDLILKDWLRGV